MNIDDRYEKIRKALELGPTPGPWDGIQNDGSGWTDIYQISNRYATPIVYVPPYIVIEEHGIGEVWKESKDETIANAKHVAACDPDTIRELLAERDALAAKVERLRGALKSEIEKAVQKWGDLRNDDATRRGVAFAADILRAALKEADDERA